jgi:putative MATE family efflux protein
MIQATKKLSTYFVRKNISLAWPLAFNALLMQSMLIIDMLIIAGLGEVSLAAMGITSTLLAFFMGLQFALSNGTQLIVGRMSGAKNATGLFHALSCGVFINVCASVFFILLIQMFSEHLVTQLSDDDAIITHTLNYLFIAQYSLLVNAITLAITVFFNGQGNTKTPLRIYLLEVPFNTVISYLLVFGSDYFTGIGFVGAAYGSLIAIVLRLILLIWSLKKHPIITSLNIKLLLTFKSIKLHLAEVVPIAANYLVLSVGHTFYQLLFSQLNIYAYVAMTLVFPWLRIATQIIVAWAQAVAISITQAIGKMQRSHIKVIINSAMMVGAILSCFVALALYIFSFYVGYIYTELDEEVCIALATIMPLYVMLPLLRTYNTISGNTLRAVGKSVAVLKVHFITQWFIVLPICAVFILYLQLPLFWVFSLILAEELLKIIPFYLMLKKFT